jgi:hypothetical protein
MEEQFMKNIRSFLCIIGFIISVQNITLDGMDSKSKSTNDLPENISSPRKHMRNRSKSTSDVFGLKTYNDVSIDQLPDNEIPIDYVYSIKYSTIESLLPIIELIKSNIYVKTHDTNKTLSFIGKARTIKQFIPRVQEEDAYLFFCIIRKIAHVILKSESKSKCFNPYDNQTAKGAMLIFYDGSPCSLITPWGRWTLSSDPINTSAESLQSKVTLVKRNDIITQPDGTTIGPIYKITEFENTKLRYPRIRAKKDLINAMQARTLWQDMEKRYAKAQEEKETYQQKIRPPKSPRKQPSVASIFPSSSSSSSTQVTKLSHIPDSLCLSESELTTPRSVNTGTGTTSDSDGDDEKG